MDDVLSEYGVEKQTRGWRHYSQVLEDVGELIDYVVHEFDIEEISECEPAFEYAGEVFSSEAAVAAYLLSEFGIEEEQYSFVRRLMDIAEG